AAHHPSHRRPLPHPTRRPSDPATDAAGNEGAASTGFTVIEDTVAPNAPTISTVNDNVSPVTGDLANGASTNDTTLTVSGTAEAGSTVAHDDTAVTKAPGIPAAT